jgi:ketosteroid isomerase-like protein
MSGENVEIVRRMYEAINHRDVATIVSLLSPEAVYFPRAEDATASPYRGATMADEFLSTVNFAGEFRVEPEEIQAVGDSVLVKFTQTLRPRGASGAAIEERRFNVWVLHDGLIVEGRVFSRESDALEAVGLRE